MQQYSHKDKERFDKLFWNRQEASQIEKQYLEKTQQNIKYIKWIPWIKMVWVWNSLAMNSATKDSDIDLLIVTGEKRIWLVRIFCTLIFQIMWVRKTEKKHAWRMCLSFFCTLNWLDFSKFSLEKDPYLYFWILSFKPILDYNNTYNLFLEKNKIWADFNIFKNTLKENKKYIKYSKITSLKENFSPFLKVLDSVLNIIDNLLKKLFLPKTMNNYEKKWKPFWIIINDEILKFHDWDIRKEITKKMW